MHPKPVRSFSHKNIPVPKGFTPLIFDQDIPLDIEIGAGVGYHSIQYALSHPQRHLVAFERTHVKFAKLERRLIHHPKVNNLTAIHGDAVAWISHGVLNESVEKIFLFYPNPELKNPAQRWARRPFMFKLIQVLKKGGTILLTTNTISYWQEAEKYFKHYWKLKILHSQSLEPAQSPRTHFERKYLSQGQTCYEILAEKV